jgi:hypothetical protein
MRQSAFQSQTEEVMASSTTRVTLANSARKLPKGAKLVGAADPKQEIEISVRLRAKRADDEQVMALGAQPPRERQYLSRAEFGAEMGADPADVAKIDDSVYKAMVANAEQRQEGGQDHPQRAQYAHRPRRGDGSAIYPPNPKPSAGLSSWG